MQSYTLYFIRHGAIEETLKGRYIGSTDARLSEKGKRSLKQISEQFGYPYAEKIYSGPLSRCIESCSIIYPSREIKTVGSLSECSFGEWEGKSASELAGDPAFALWLQNSDKTPPPGGESGKQFASRVCKGFERIVEDIISSGTKTAAIVTHGGVIMTILSVFVFFTYKLSFQNLHCIIKRIYIYFIPICIVKISAKLLKVNRS